MSKEQVSKNQDFSVTRLDRAHLGREKEILSIEGDSGDFVIKDLQGNEAIKVNANSGIVEINGQEINATVTYAAGSRPAADEVGASPSNVVMIWNSTSKQPEWSDGTNWYDADGNIT